MKYNTGDRVKLVNYGHQTWIRPKDGDKVKVYDLQPDLVGREAIVVEGVTTQNQEKYVLDIKGKGKQAWFSTKQLVLIKKNTA